MKILLTGHDGYIGVLLTDMLARSGHEVVGVDAHFFKGCGLEPALPLLEVPETAFDVRDLGQAGLKGLDAVVHLAALSNDPLGSLSPSLTDTINRVASLRLADMAKAEGVPRFVFASSCSLYGEGGTGMVAEDASLEPLTAYGRSKVAVEEGLSALADDTFSPTSLRAATVYGVSPRLRGDVVVNNLVGSAVTRGEVRLQSDGKSWRPLLHVEDLCRAFLAVLEAPREHVHDEAFNVVPAGENYQIRDLAEMVAEQIPGCAVTLSGGVGHPDPRSYRVDGAKFTSAVPGFVPRWTVPGGIAQLLSSLTARDLSEAEFFGPRFLRIDRLRGLMKSGQLDETLRWRGRNAPGPNPPSTNDVGWANPPAPGR